MENIPSIIPKLVLLAAIVSLLTIVRSDMPTANAAVVIDVENQTSCEAAPVSGTWTAANSTCLTSANLNLNHGDLLTFGNITLVSTGTISNSGDISPGAVFHPYHAGRLINFGTVNNNNDGFIGITGGGFITNSKQGTINNNGPIFVNSNSKGTYGIANSGTINNYNSIRIDGFFKNLPNGVLSNHGTFWNDEGGYTTNKQGATINNYGTLNNTAQIVFGANFNNLGGTIKNMGSIFNQKGGCSGCGPGDIVFNNTGIVINSGLFSNSERVNENCGGMITGNAVSGNAPSVYSCSPPHNTGTTVMPNPATSSVGQKMTFHVKVIDSSNTGQKVLPTGQVTWSDGGAGGTFSSAATCTLTQLTSISACTISYTAPLAHGTVTITAAYAGDSNHNSSSGVSTLTVSS